MPHGAKIGGGGGRNYERENEYDWFNAPEWEGLKAYKDLDFNKLLGDQLLAPEQERQFATTARDLKTSFNSPYGGERSQDEASGDYEQALLRLAEAKGSATEQANFDRSRALAGFEAQRGANVAGLTAPRLENTKESGFIPNPDGGFWGSFKKGLGGGLGKGLGGVISGTIGSFI